MDIIWLAAAGFILAIAFFDRELLIERRSRKVTFGASQALFVAAIILPIFMRDLLLSRNQNPSLPVRVRTGRKPGDILLNR